MFILNRSKGFSLLELLCCLGLIAILATFTTYQYTGWLQKTHRMDAKQSLEYWAYRLEHQPGLHSRLLVGVRSLEGYYRIRLWSINRDDYFLEARPINQQTQDTACPFFRLAPSGRRTSKPGC